MTNAIGHLSKEDARHFWDQKIACVRFQNRKPLTFAEMFEVSGGNMFLIEMMYFDYIYGDIHPEESLFTTD